MNKTNKFKINVGIRYNGINYYVVSDKNELLSSIFNEFAAKTGEYDKDLTFTYNQNLYLDPMKKLDEEIDINNLNYIYIDAVVPKNIIGGYPFKFTDLSKQITEDHYFSDEAPSYRIVTRGINIYGICNFKKCNAYKKEVIVPLEGVKSFNLINERENLACPSCEAIIIPKTIGFHRCEYVIKGTKFENQKCESFDFKGKAINEDSVQYYNPEKNGETIIVELEIKVTKFL